MAKFPIPVKPAKERKPLPQPKRTTAPVRHR
jgi:hypothetical protein